MDERAQQRINIVRMYYDTQAADMGADISEAFLHVCDLAERCIQNPKDGPLAVKLPFDVGDHVRVKGLTRPTLIVMDCYLDKHGRTNEQIMLVCCGWFNENNDMVYGGFQDTLLEKIPERTSGKNVSPPKTPEERRS